MKKKTIKRATTELELSRPVTFFSEYETAIEVPKVVERSQPLKITILESPEEKIEIK